MLNYFFLFETFHYTYCALFDQTKIFYQIETKKSVQCIVYNEMPTYLGHNEIGNILKLQFVSNFGCDAHNQRDRTRPSYSIIPLIFKAPGLILKF